VLEAMACGLPVVVSAQAGVAELLRDGVDGLLLADPGDVDALAAALARLVGDETLRKRLGERAAVTAQDYTWATIAARVDTIYRDVARSRR
jgi:glycosyltransferase involved in cell wall biosynthesis